MHRKNLTNSRQSQVSVVVVAVVYFLFYKEAAAAQDNAIAHLHLI